MLSNRTRDTVVAFVSECVQGLPIGTATLEVADDEDGLTKVTVTPARPSAAPIAFGVDDDSITVVLGLCTTVELLSDAPGLRGELRALVQCAFDGMIQERVWRRQGRIIRCVSRIVVDGKTSRFGSADALDIAPFSSVAIEDYVYDRYFDSP